MNRIKELREQKMADEGPEKWTQKALAERLGAHESTVITWETGERRPRRFYQIRLARQLGVSIEELGLAQEGIEGAEEVTDVSTPPSEESST